jgi:UDP-N-acetylmuramoylalanine-D-glutamate ligase
MKLHNPKVKSTGTSIISEIEFAGRYTMQDDMYHGSNGKTTTTSLINHIFKSAGVNVGLPVTSKKFSFASCNRTTRLLYY